MKCDFCGSEAVAQVSAWTVCAACEEKRRPPVWRVGRKVGRTVYVDDVLVGIMDTPELAAEVVAAMNGREGKEGGK